MDLPRFFYMLVMLARHTPFYNGGKGASMLIWHINVSLISQNLKAVEMPIYCLCDSKYANIILVVSVDKRDNVDASEKTI